MAAPLSSCPSTLAGFPATQNINSTWQMGPNSATGAICISGCNEQFTQNIGPSYHPTPTPPNDAFLGGCINTCMANYPESQMDSGINTTSAPTVVSSFQGCTADCRFSCRVKDATRLPTARRFNVCDIDCSAVCQAIPECGVEVAVTHYPANLAAWWTAAWCSVRLPTATPTPFAMNFKSHDSFGGCFCTNITPAAGSNLMCYNSGPSGITNHDWFA
jgi:hypothetical protein